MSDDELAGIGPALGNDRGGLAPDQLGPAGAEASVSAEGQLARRAVGLAVAPLHRLDRQPVADAPAADLDRPEQRREVLAHLNVQRHRRASASSLSLDLYLKYRDTQFPRMDVALRRPTLRWPPVPWWHEQRLVARSTRVARQSLAAISRRIRLLRRSSRTRPSRKATGGCQSRRTLAVIAKDRLKAALQQEIAPALVGVPASAVSRLPGNGRSECVPDQKCRSRF